MTKDLNFHALDAFRIRNGQDPLVAFLASARGGAVTISARDVARLESHRLQILLSAEQQWQADGLPFAVIDTSQSFVSGLQRLGLSPDHFDKEASQ